MPASPQKAALVTGAARGIGLATAKRFLAEGWRVALLDIEGELLHGAVAGLADPDNTLELHCDVSDAKAVAIAMAAVSARFGRLDALVNNAGIAVFAPLLDTSDEDWSRILQVNLTGPFICTKAAAPLMREHGGGAIVNITSISAVRASTLRSAYGTSSRSHPQNSSRSNWLRRHSRQRRGAGWSHRDGKRSSPEIRADCRAIPLAPAQRSWRKRSLPVQRSFGYITG
jgi:NADP-dependent 3-hydroxy acid dehydrogenase YdfG